MSSARSIIDHLLFYFIFQVPADDFPAQRTAIDTLKRLVLRFYPKHSKQDAYYWLVIQQL
jgi:hypothetical protein